MTTGRMGYNSSNDRDNGGGNYRAGDNVSSVGRRNFHESRKRLLPDRSG